ncbi:MAG: ferritin-like domain-containing protein, partial [Ramlibacter sp.]|nr:ferritin-like domain-containing protein [Ramlibacter sp.]
MTTLRRSALAVVQERDPGLKAQKARALDPGLPCAADEDIADPGGLPGRPDEPRLVGHTELKQRSVRTTEGRAALIHALAHIELNAIDLAADVIWRFAGMPDGFYRQWTVVAQEEALHFQLLSQHLESMGYRYGQFPAHNALWDMAERTRHDPL